MRAGTIERRARAGTREWMRASTMEKRNQGWYQIEDES
jgi:hypothetical protein